MQFRTSGRKIGLIALSASVLIAGGVGAAIATTNAPPPNNAVSKGRGIDQYGITKANFHGKRLNFTYSHGFWCDTSVKSAASSKCEVGATFNKAPAKHFDPLYITVPLGFNKPMTECPPNLVCVDHPGTIGLARLTGALKPLYPDVPRKKLRHILQNFPVPGHDHYVTDRNGGQPEWWDVQVVGVTSPKTYHNIVQHKSFGFIKHLIKNKNKHVVGPIPSNLFLYFAVK